MSYPTGVPSPYTMHVHPYPTRFHGGSWRRPVFGMPYIRQPFNVIRPSQEHVPLHVPQTPPLVTTAGNQIAGFGVWDTGSGVFRRPKLDGGGIFNAISGLGASLGMSPMTTTFVGAGVLAAGLTVFLASRPKKMTANKRRAKRRRAPRSSLITTAARAAANRHADVVTAFNADWSGKLGDLGISESATWDRYLRAYNAEKKRTKRKRRRNGSFGSGDWATYYEKDGEPQIHRVRSRKVARTNALNLQRAHGGYVTVTHKGLEKDSVGPGGASWLGQTPNRRRFR